MIVFSTEKKYDGNVKDHIESIDGFCSINILTILILLVLEHEIRFIGIFDFFHQGWFCLVWFGSF